jgi:hypothetical protein
MTNFITFIFIFLLFINDFKSLNSSTLVKNECTEDTLSSRINDFIVFELKICLLTDDRQIDKPFILKYSQLSRWKSILYDFMDNNGINDDDRHELDVKIHQQLIETDQFPEVLLSDVSSNLHSMSVSTVSMLRSLFASKVSSLDEIHNISNFLFLTNKERQLHSYRFPLTTFLRRPDLPPHPSIQPVLPSYIMEEELQDEESPRIIIYQTRNAFTGGTTAMRILHTTIKELGFKTTLCNDTNSQFDLCSKPRGKTVDSRFLRNLLTFLFYSSRYCNNR